MITQNFINFNNFFRIKLETKTQTHYKFLEIEVLGGLEGG